MEIKLTKSALRAQQLKYHQLNKYLPTLQLKKALLQLEVNAAQAEIETLQSHLKNREERVESFSALFADLRAFELFVAVKIEEVQVRYENIAGIDIPLFESVLFAPANYALFDTPLWLESAIKEVKGLLSQIEHIKVVEKKKALLQKELREVSIRVNLFEKIMIPRALANIKKIKIFLSDQQLAAVSQAKVAKAKILKRVSQNS